MLLVLDTATDVVVTALADGEGRVRAERASVGHERSARLVLGDVAAVLAEAGATLDDVELLVAGRGPGSFTGLRIGLTTAAALGAARGIPVVGASSLDALLRGAPAGAAAVVDARRREVFAAAPGLPAGTYAPADLVARLPAGTTCVGDGAIRYRAALEAAGLVVPPDGSPLHAPGGSAYARLALEAPAPATPLYLREPDAVPAPALAAGGARGR